MENPKWMTSFKNNLSLNITVTDQDNNCTPHIISESQINLETFPDFTGDRSQYLSWRKYALTHMGNIECYSTTPTYYTALLILLFLNSAYADQRYVLPEEMKKIIQGKRILSKFHGEVSKAINPSLTKI